ncbi:FUSC family protein [Streptomyces sp. NPDC059441]|uniref:FUSC family protein n=1 Tax=Streptomyces sp. NPDC059441 TaxID=3346829 RepID=UPI00369159A4
MRVPGVLPQFGVVRRQRGDAIWSPAAVRWGVWWRAWLGVRWRPQGPADWGAGVAAGLALAMPLLIGTALGHPEAGAALVLPVVLVVMPLPAQAGPGERARRLATRTLWITLAGVYACLIHGNDWALVPAVALTAAVGALAPRVSVTAPLAFLLVGITGPAEAFGVPGLPQLAGCLWGGILALPRWGRTPPRPPGPRPPAPPPPVPTVPPAPPAARPLAHAARLAALTGAAMTLITAPHQLAGDGHWLVTGVLLALTPTPHTTLVKARQRAVGTSVGCTGVALVLAAQPGPWAIVATVAVLGTLAYGLRPANYLYWCIAFSPLLLLLADFNTPTPWYTAGVRAALVTTGSLTAVLASHWLWPHAFHTDPH